jgi:hypothetical protein
MRAQAISWETVIRPALALTALANPRWLRSVLLSMIGWRTAPSAEPAVTIDMASALRFSK